ncbi:UPF0502 protein [Bryobacterales bacterium F-183]|nr:UPF0502 protein [Bryobacterales bacterium F-183]
MLPELTPVEARVLGSLIEKDLTTPEYYPLSLNALMNACNQKSSREPVVSYSEQTVEEATQSLRAKGLVLVHSGSRATKYSHRLSEKFNFGRRDLPLLGVLLLRGPQTLGELRTRTERMYDFSDLEEVERVLLQLAESPNGALVKRLPPQPGMKEQRWAHLLCGEPANIEAAVTVAHDADGRGDRITRLENEVASLRQELDWLKEKLASLLA